MSAIGFGYPGSTRRLGSVGSPVNSTVEVRNAGRHVLLVFVPGDTVYPDSRCLLQIVEGFQQAVLVDVMQQGCELERAVLAGSFTHTVQTA